MKTMKCKACGKDISPKAKACPGCGHPNTPSTLHEIGRLFQVMAFGGVSLFLLFFFLTRPGNQEQSEPYSPPVVPRCSVSAAERVAIDEAKTKALVEQLKTVPEAMHHRNRDLYKQLVALAPNHAKYQERYEYYEQKASADDLAAQSDVLIPRSMAGDKGKYFLIESKKTGNIVRAISKRIGVDTIGYTLTETNCETMLMREIGYSEVSASAIVSKPTKWFGLTPGSSKSDLANFVCK